MPTFRLHLVLDTGEHVRADTEQRDADAARAYVRTINNVAFLKKIKLVRAA